MSKDSGFEHNLERGIFASRWLLAPMYVGLIGGLVLVMVMFFIELVHLVQELQFSGKEATTAEDLTVALLTLIDIALLGNLILIVIFAGYENFVSKIAVAEGSEDRPSWMGHVDFSGLKMKLIGSLVAISAILLLKDFVEVGNDEVNDYTSIAWRIGLHFTFVLSGVMFALMDFWGAKRLKILHEIHLASGKKDDVEPFDDEAS
jgi:uncharacterized protein (TIGR00645 family)